MIHHDLMLLLVLILSTFHAASPQNECKSYSFITEGLVGSLVNGFYDIITTGQNGRPVYSYACAKLYIYYVNTTVPHMWVLGAEIGSEAGFAFKESDDLDSAAPWWLWSIEKNDWEKDVTARLSCTERECRHIRVRGTILDVLNGNYSRSSNTDQQELMYKHRLADNVFIKRSTLPAIDGRSSTGWTFQRNGQVLMYSEYTSCGPINRSREWVVQKNSVFTIHNDITITCLDNEMNNKEVINEDQFNSLRSNLSSGLSTYPPIITQEYASSALENMTSSINTTLSPTIKTSPTNTATTTLTTTTPANTPTTTTATTTSTTTTTTSTTTTPTTTTSTTTTPTTTTTTTTTPTTTTRTTTTTTTTPSTTMSPSTRMTTTVTTPRVYDPKDEAFPYQASGCGTRQASAPSLFIVGADDVSYEGKWPWTVAIYDTKKNFICSGALISLDHIITAGHCFAGQKNNSTHYVIFGAYDLSKDSEQNRQTSNISRFVVHQNYSRLTEGSFRVYHDIAMVVLETPVKVTTYVRPVCLPKTSPEAATSCYIAGFGQRGYTGEVGTVQHDQTTNIMNISRCGDLLSAGWMTNTSTFCATPQNHAKICKGDSGSPLMCKFGSSDEYSIVGIASWSLTICLLSDFPSIYVNVHDYLQWLFAEW